MLGGKECAATALGHLPPHWTFPKAAAGKEVKGYFGSISTFMMGRKAFALAPSTKVLIALLRTVKWVCFKGAGPNVLCQHWHSCSRQHCRALLLRSFAKHCQFGNAGCLQQSFLPAALVASLTWPAFEPLLDAPALKHCHSKDSAHTVNLGLQTVVHNHSFSQLDKRVQEQLKNSHVHCQRGNSKGQKLETQIRQVQEKLEMQVQQEQDKPVGINAVLKSARDSHDALPHPQLQPPGSY